jgi:glycosyltransferase involved in cell wall biosynthesis
MTIVKLEGVSNGMSDLRVLIVSEHASAKFGGEAALALHYFRVLQKRGIPAWLVTHERTRAELETLLPEAVDRMIFVSDTAAHRFLWRITKLLPTRLSTYVTRFLMRLITQLAQRRVIRKLVSEQAISVIHQPMPVSPKEPSMIFGMGVPVIIGPMNGGMDYPVSFRHMQPSFEKFSLLAGRRLSNLLNWLIPGKRRAAMLLVANDRTRDALPQSVSKHIETLVENGVDLTLWNDSDGMTAKLRTDATRYIFLGRLVDWKGVDILLAAFERARSSSPMSLAIVGDGDERPALEHLARKLGLIKPDGIAGGVQFLGWMSQADCAVQLRNSDVLVLPSLLECGGAVVLEAMAMGKPVIATDWGGPADYLDPTCGVLVEPVSRSFFVEGLSQAMIALSSNPEIRLEMGRAGRAKVLEEFDWEVKVDRMLEIYQSVINTFKSSHQRTCPEMLGDVVG